MPDVTTPRSSFHVDPTGDYPFPPVRVSAFSGAAHLQDYLTVDQARSLAQRLLRVADEVEGHGDA